MMLSLEVVKPGMLTTVQDLGRFGRQMQGVPVAGAMDSAALCMGNILLGNDENAAGLEITMLGPTLKVLSGEVCFAVTGAAVGVSKNDVSIQCWAVYRLTPGDVLSFSPPSRDGGARAYFCVSGGLIRHCSPYRTQETQTFHSIGGSAYYWTAKFMFFC